jgi:hypothetical protein
MSVDSDHSTRQHAVFSPSAAHRWMECPGSIRLCADVPRETSFAADEGTAAHQLAATCLFSGRDPIDYLGEPITVEGAVFPITEGMCEAVQVYLDYVRSFVALGYTLTAEARLDLGHLSPGQFGTGDAVLYSDKLCHLVVTDLKYGRFVVVDVEDNPQLLSYASGAASAFSEFDQQIKRITLAIVQPRAPGQAVRSWDITIPDLQAFELDFKQAVWEASQPDAPLAAGEWCRFCPATATCPEFRHLALRLAQAEFDTTMSVPATVTLPDPTTLDPTQLGHILAAADLIEEWIAAVNRHALAQALKGEIPAGYKLVRKNTLRRWVDEQKAAQALTTLYDLDVDSLWVSKLLSPAQAEKMLPKDARASLTPLITRPDGDATLAPLSDKRPALNVDAKKEFDSVISHVQPSIPLTKTSMISTEKKHGAKSQPE